MEERSQTENNESIPNDENVPRETIIGGDEGITNLTSNRNGDVKFRNGSSHVNNGYEHTEMWSQFSNPFMPCLSSFFFHDY